MDGYEKISYNDTKFQIFKRLKTCAICTLGLYDDASGDKLGLTLKELDCHHVFHYACVMTWMAISPTCPTCRHDVKAKKEKPTKISPLSKRRKARRMMTLHDLGVSNAPAYTGGTQRRRIAVGEGEHMKRPLRFH